MKQSIRNFADETTRQIKMITSKHISNPYFMFLSSCTVRLRMPESLKERVYDRVTNEPLIGATISPDSSTKGIITDIDGNYNVQLQDGLHRLYVKYIGYSDTILSVKVPIGA